MLFSFFFSTIDEHANEASERERENKGGAREIRRKSKALFHCLVPRSMHFDDVSETNASLGPCDPKRIGRAQS